MQSFWRATTFNLLSIICSRPGKEVEHAQPPIRLDTYPGFESYMSSASATRITLASTTKSFKKSHYGTVRIPTDESNVCLRNALQYRLYDKDTDIWAAEPIECDIQHHCTLQLPRTGPYRNLQFAVDTTSHTSNSIIAKQHKCPTDLDLHEYLAFTSLRSGHRLQWMNIAREIRTRSLSFHRQEVHTLLAQVVWQAGNALPNRTRESHIDLNSTQFCSTLLQELWDLLNTIRANWQEIATINTIITLTTRLLASTNDPTVISIVYDLLRTARTVCFGWAKMLGRKIQENGDAKNTLELQMRICEMAATCRGTFDVEPNHFPQLYNSAEDLSIMVQCAILVHDTSPPNQSTPPYGLKRLLERNTRVAHSLERHTRHLIQMHPEGLDQAITALWTAFCPGSDWQAMDPPNDRWVIALSAVGPNQQAQYVQLNLLNGLLLVNSEPLGRLPAEIIANPTYSRVLGNVRSITFELIYRC